MNSLTPVSQTVTISEVEEQTLVNSMLAESHRIFRRDLKARKRLREEQGAVINDLRHQIAESKEMSRSLTKTFNTVVAKNSEDTEKHQKITAAYRDFLAGSAEKK